MAEDVAWRAVYTYTSKVTTQFLASQNWTDITISESVFRHMTLKGLVDIYRRFGRGVSAHMVHVTADITTKSLRYQGRPLVSVHY